MLGGFLGRNDSFRMQLRRMLFKCMFKIPSAGPETNSGAGYSEAPDAEAFNGKTDKEGEVEYLKTISTKC